MSISIANRNQSWIDMQETLSKKRYEAYQWIKKHEPVSPQILCEIYNMRFNELAPRFTELFDIGYIKEYGAIHNKRSNKHNTAYVTTPLDEIADVRESIRNTFKRERDAIIDDVAMNALLLSHESIEWLNKRVSQLERKIKKLQ